MKHSKIFAVAIVLFGCTLFAHTAQAQTIDIEMAKVDGSGDIKTFQIGKYEVTQAQWQAVMGNNPSQFKGDKLPVENVSWNDVQEFIKKLNAKTGKNYRLPAESEWYLASVGGNAGLQQITIPMYAGGDDVDAVAWYIKNSKKTTHNVGTKQPNSLGIFDMSGNVWEWCADFFDEAKKEYIARGGSWYNEPKLCAVSYRNHAAADLRAMHIGFRLAITETETTTTTPATYTLTLIANPSEGGTVSGAGKYAANKTADINAKAADGYKFKEWEEIGAVNPHTYKMPAKDVTLTAKFEKIEKQPIAEVVPQQPSVTPTTPQQPSVVTPATTPQEPKKPETPTTGDKKDTPKTEVKTSAKDEPDFIAIIREQEKFPLKYFRSIPNIFQVISEEKDLTKYEKTGHYDVDWVKSGLISAEFVGTNVAHEMFGANAVHYQYYKATLTAEGKKYTVPDTEQGYWLNSKGSEWSGVQVEKLPDMKGQPMYQHVGAYLGTVDIGRIVSVKLSFEATADMLKSMGKGYKSYKVYDIVWEGAISDVTPFAKTVQIGYYNDYYYHSIVVIADGKVESCDTDWRSYKKDKIDKELEKSGK
jgi:hypothetical protein